MKIESHVLTLDDLILQKTNRDILTAEIQNIPNLLLVGMSGEGKTTIAKCLINKHDTEFKFYNASAARGIDVLRDEIYGFATRKSFVGKKKIIVLDEFDNTTNEFQMALRSFVDTYSKNVLFILTANYIQRILPEIQDRFKILNFSSDRGPEIIEQLRKKFTGMLDERKIKYTDEAILSYIKAPTSIRNKVSELLICVDDNNNFVGYIDTTGVDEFINIIKTRDFNKIKSFFSKYGKFPPVALYNAMFSSFMIDDTVSTSALIKAVDVIKRHYVDATNYSDRMLIFINCLLQLCAIDYNTEEII